MQKYGKQRGGWVEHRALGLVSARWLSTRGDLQEERETQAVMLDKFALEEVLSFLERLERCAVDAPVLAKVPRTHSNTWCASARRGKVKLPNH